MINFFAGNFQRCDRAIDQLNADVIRRAYHAVMTRHRDDARAFCFALSGMMFLKLLKRRLRDLDEVVHARDKEISHRHRAQIKAHH